ncbi:hypothetical protein COLO4_12690 [Corchorus olitorius]|uniref:Uncharacterized protein n=1 Tax=Corchorus olitorius TaxID=93759 RepID=A0A1R3K054_9ROSI|nr:hypothetical protein COLO4_12690 [Corchorus olitorius]
MKQEPLRYSVTILADPLILFTLAGTAHFHQSEMKTKN